MNRKLKSARLYKLRNKTTGKYIDLEYYRDVMECDYVDASPIYIINRYIQNHIIQGRKVKLVEYELETIQIVHTKINGNMKLNKIVDRLSQEVLLNKLKYG